MRKRDVVKLLSKEFILLFTNMNKNNIVHHHVDSVVYSETESNIGFEKFVLFSNKLKLVHISVIYELIDRRLMSLKELLNESSLSEGTNPLFYNSDKSVNLDVIKKYNNPQSIETGLRNREIKDCYINTYNFISHQFDIMYKNVEIEAERVTDKLELLLKKDITNIMAIPEFKDKKGNRFFRLDPFKPIFGSSDLYIYSKNINYSKYMPLNVAKKIMDYTDDFRNHYFRHSYAKSYKILLPLNKDVTIITVHPYTTRNVEFIGLKYYKFKRVLREIEISNNKLPNIAMDYIRSIKQ